MKTLERYWQILIRRKQLALIPCLAAFVFGLITFEFPRAEYEAEVRFITAQTPLPITLENEEQRLYNWRASEYIVHGIKDWVNGSIFLGMVQAELIQRGYGQDQVEIDQLQEIVSSSALASQVIVLITAEDKDLVETIQEIVTPLVIEKHQGYIPHLGNKPADLRLVDGNYIERIPPSTGEYLTLFRQTLAGLMSGLLLVLFAEYFDPFVNTDDDIAQLGLPAIGLIPSTQRQLVLREMPAFLWSRFQKIRTSVVKSRV